MYFVYFEQKYVSIVYNILFLMYVAHLWLLLRTIAWNEWLHKMLIFTTYTKFNFGINKFHDINLDIFTVGKYVSATTNVKEKASKGLSYASCIYSHYFRGISRRIMFHSNSQLRKLVKVEPILAQNKNPWPFLNRTIPGLLAHAGYNLQLAFTLFTIITEANRTLLWTFI